MVAMHGLIRQVWGRRAWTRAGGTVTRVALNGTEARTAIGNYFRFCSNERPHQALSYHTPAEVCLSISVEASAGSQVK